MTEPPQKDDRDHTAGPWTTDGSHIYAPDGAIIATVSNPGSKASDYPLIANRDVMAASPDLLRELEALVSRLKAVTPPGTLGLGYGLDGAEAAIAKARRRA